MSLFHFTNGMIDYMRENSFYYRSPQDKEGTDMIQQIIDIDEEKCDGCGICADGCHEGAIDIIDGKAKVVGEDFYDCFIYCLPECPMGAITFNEQY